MTEVAALCDYCGDRPATRPGIVLGSSVTFCSDCWATDGDRLTSVRPSDLPVKAVPQDADNDDDGERLDVLEQEGIVPLWHGTSAHLRASIERDGLLVRNRTPPFVSISRGRAEAHCIPAVARAYGGSGGTLDLGDGTAPPLALLLRIGLPIERLEQHPSTSQTLDFVVPGGVEPEAILQWIEFDIAADLSVAVIVETVVDADRARIIDDMLDAPRAARRTPA